MILHEEHSEVMSFTTKSGGRLVIAEATGIQQPVTGVRRKTGDRKSHRDPARRSISSPVQRESPQQGKRSQKVEGPSARQYAGTPGPRGRVMSARQHDQCGPGVASVHRQGVSTPVRKHELARQHAERLPAHRIRQTLCGVPLATQARPQHFKMSFELQVSQASSTEAILGLGGCWVTTTFRKSACASSCAHRYSAEGSGSRRVIDRSDLVT